jgi:hypothetical protein
MTLTNRTQNGLESTKSDNESPSDSLTIQSMFSLLEM